MCDDRDRAEAEAAMTDAAEAKVPSSTSSNGGEDDTEGQVRAAIFAAIPPYQDSDEEEACRSIVASLTEAEREQAARTSYAYFAASSSADDDDSSSIDADVTTRMAMRMARRHVVAENGDVNAALAKMRDTLRFREEVRIDDVRRCLSVGRPCDDDDDESDPLAEMRAKIKMELHVQPTFVRGYDRSDRAILIKSPRGPPPPLSSSPSGDFDEEAYVLASLHVAERALACTERRSLGRLEKIVVALDYADYASANVPPIAVLRRSFAALQRHYPERLYRLVIVDAPFFMRGIWAIVSPLLDADTVEKVKFVTGDVQKEQVLGPLIAEDQAMPFLLPGGELTSPVDVNRLITGVPFDHAYDDDV